MKFIHFLPLLIAGAPVFSGASAQNNTTPDPDSLKSQSFDWSLFIKTFTEADPDDSLSFNTTSHSVVKTVKTDLVLDNIIKQAKKDNTNNKKLSSSSILDFMTKAYADHGFYQSGNWDDAEDFSYITRNIPLPKYDPADFYRPVWGRVTSSYGFRPSFGRLHKGIDLALKTGDTVRAALPGVVAKVGYDARGYGNYVVLVHNNGMETRYAHLQGAITTPGQTLYAGEPLGLGGNSGNSTGPHLHFEVRYRGTALDPASLFNFYATKKRE